MKTKKILHRIRWFIYIGFFCLFIKGIGLYRGIIHDEVDPMNNPGHPVAFTKADLSNMGILRFDQKVQMKADSIVKIRREEVKGGDRYTFSDYAYDFAQIDDFIFSFGKNPDKYLMAKNNLVNFFYERMRTENSWVSDEQRIEAENIYSSMMGVFGKFSSYQDPEDVEEKSSLKDFWSWLVKKYFKLFPLAFLLYVFWFFVDTRASKYMKRNPLSLLFSLAIYPILIFILIRNLFVEKARETLAATDYRRTKDEFFSVLSKDELGRIKDFARSSRKLFEWRKELKDEGRVFKHSFVLVLSFTIFLGFMFRSTSICAETKSDKRTEIYQFVKEKTDSIAGVWDFQALDEGVLPDIIPWPRLLSQKIKFINNHIILENGFIPDIGHIPNSVSNF